MQSYQHFDYGWKTAMQQQSVTCVHDVAVHIIVVSRTLYPTSQDGFVVLS